MDWRVFFPHVKQVIAEIMTLSSAFICGNFSDLRVTLVLIRLEGKLHVGREVSSNWSAPGHSSGCQPSDSLSLSLSPQRDAVTAVTHGGDGVSDGQEAPFRSRQTREAFVLRSQRLPEAFWLNSGTLPCTHSSADRQISTCATFLSSPNDRFIRTLRDASPHGWFLCAPLHPLTYTITHKKTNKLFVGGAVFIHVRMEEMKQRLDCPRTNTLRWPPQTLRLGLYHKLWKYWHQFTDESLKRWCTFMQSPSFVIRFDIFFVTFEFFFFFFFC